MGICAAASALWGTVQPLQFYEELFSRFSSMRNCSAASALWGTVQPLQLYEELFSHFSFMRNCSAASALWGTVQSLQLYEELFSRFSFMRSCSAASALWGTAETLQFPLLLSDEIFKGEPKQPQWLSYTKIKWKCNLFFSLPWKRTFLFLECVLLLYWDFQPSVWRGNPNIFCKGLLQRKYV